MPRRRLHTRNKNPKSRKGKRCRAQSLRRPELLLGDELLTSFGLRRQSSARLWRRRTRRRQRSQLLRIGLRSERTFPLVASGHRRWRCPRCLWLETSREAACPIIVFKLILLNHADSHIPSNAPFSIFHVSDRTPPQPVSSYAS